MVIGRASTSCVCEGLSYRIRFCKTNCPIRFVKTANLLGSRVLATQMHVSTFTSMS